jgi:hypothetical protein
MIVTSNHGFTEPIKAALLFFVLGFILGAAVTLVDWKSWLSVAFYFGAVSAYLAGAITGFAWLVHRLFYTRPPAAPVVDDEPEIPGDVTYQVISKDGLA